MAVNSPIFHLSLGLANLEIDDKLKKINLRREEYTFKSIDRRLEANLKYAGILLAVIFFTSGFNLVFDLFEKRNENKALGNRITSIYREMIPSGKVVDEVVQAEQYMGRVKEEFQKFQEIME